MMSVAYLSLGSNMGDRLSHLKQAIMSLNGHPLITVTRASSIYETDPVGFTDQDAFLNMVVEVETSLSADSLLTACLETEQSLGRVRLKRWGPRTIDLDLLLYDDVILHTDRLILPHPRMHERSFVLIPLLDANPDLLHPALHQPLQTILQSLQDQEGVRLWKTINGASVSALFES